MGLDMYLTKEIYIGAYWEHRGIAGKIEITAHGEAIPVELSRVTSITEQVMYWRKSNQIHNWFVKNIQDGQDDCERYWVPREKLCELYDLIVKILNGKTKKDRQFLAESLLPPADGFFFGSTDIDEYYFADLKDTETVLKNVVEQIRAKNSSLADADFYYRASW